MAFRTLLTAFVIAIAGWPGHQECRATSIQDLLDNSKGLVTYGNLTFTFTDKSVTSDPAGKPTAAQVDVSAVTNGIMFSFNPMLSLTTPDALDQFVTITYSVSSTSTFTKAGLSFTGGAVDVNTKSEVTETFTGRAEMLDVYSMKDNKGKVTGQNNQSVDFNANLMTLAVTDTGHLSTGVRGNGATSTAQLYDITNTFFVPEPSSFVLGAIAAVVGLGVWSRHRRAAT
jgi:hypothetical protein